MFKVYHRAQLKYWAGMSDAEIKENFDPQYGFGHQRPLMSLGFIEAMRGDKVRVITSTIKELKEKSIVLDNGKELKADTIVLATGFNLDYFKFSVSIDNMQINLYDHVIRKDIFFEGVPNFVNMVLFARLDSKNFSCFTPLLESTAEMVAEAMDVMRYEGYQTMEIKPKTGVKMERYHPMSSGYFTRNHDKCFKADANELQSLGRPWHIVNGYTLKLAEYIFK